MVTGSDVLDNLNDFASQISSLGQEAITVLSQDIVATATGRTADSLDERNIQNLKRYFSLIPSKDAQAFWTMMLGSTETKRVAMPWQTDAEFCNLLRTIYGLSS